MTVEQIAGVQNEVGLLRLGDGDDLGDGCVVVVGSRVVADTDAEVPVGGVEDAGGAGRHHIPSSSERASASSSGRASTSA